MSSKDYTVTAILGDKSVTMTGEEFEKRTTAIINKTSSMSNIIPSEETRSLRYDFTAVEITSLSMQLAVKTQEIASIKEEKKSVMAQYAAKEKEAAAQITTLSNQVANGFEHRQTKCTIDWHKPSQGMKTITRTDTGQKWEEKMLSHEWNLFTQDVDENDLIHDSPLGGPELPAKKKPGKKNNSDDLPFL